MSEHTNVSTAIQLLIAYFGLVQSALDQFIMMNHLLYVIHAETGNAVPVINDRIECYY